MLDLKINHLQLLAQIVSTGSLTEAAQNLGLSAAAASRMLKKLQTEMNDPLFIRVWRGLTPTDTTTMMLPVVRELLDQMERLEYQKSFTPAKLSATITIGAADNSVISILPPVVRAIREQEMCIRDSICLRKAKALSFSRMSIPQHGSRLRFG